MASVPPVEDPGKLTILQLKSRLTALNVELPPIAQQKQVYLELLYKNDLTLKGQIPPQGDTKKKK